VLRPWCFRVSLLTASCLVAATALQWTLVDLLPFLVDLLLLALWLGLLLCCVWAAAHAVRNRRYGWRAIAPLAVCIAAWAVVDSVPFTRLWLQANFHLLREQREAVVARVQDGSLQPNVPHNASLIALGSGRTLSMGGNEIVVEEHGGEKFVFFFTHRGILDNYSGFLFVPEGGNPRAFSDLAEAESQLVPYGGPWYFAGHW
jgi:hypothetical protein